MPGLVLGEGRVSAAAVADVMAQRVVQILPVLNSFIWGRTLRAWRTVDSPLDFEPVKAEQVRTLQILDLLEEVEESRTHSCAFQPQ